MTDKEILKDLMNTMLSPMTHNGLFDRPGQTLLVNPSIYDVLDLNDCGVAIHCNILEPTWLYVCIIDMNKHEISIIQKYIDDRFAQQFLVRIFVNGRIFSEDQVRFLDPESVHKYTVKEVDNLAVKAIAPRPEMVIDEVIVCPGIGFRIYKELTGSENPMYMHVNTFKPSNEHAVSVVHDKDEGTVIEIKGGCTTGFMLLNLIGAALLEGSLYFLQRPQGGSDESSTKH